MEVKEGYQEKNLLLVIIWPKNLSFNFFILTNITNGRFDSEYLHTDDESNQLRQEYKMRKMRQECASLELSMLHEIKVEVIAEGLDTPKNMTHDMSEVGGLEFELVSSGNCLPNPSKLHVSVHLPPLQLLIMDLLFL
ncbi:hypothetical protein ACH5RR_024816 [Cinchona calisaya]|uniref:Uncharacterized protein n=1 Tax=Cinchona calisaya TaxID=153742 RepID=A0ABD2YXV3_9GENT